MYFIFIIAAIILSFYTYYCYLNSSDIKAVIALVTMLIMLGAAVLVNWNTNQLDKVKLLNEMGMEPLTTEQVYDMSTRQLDNCKTICTVDKVYYYKKEAK